VEIMADDISTRLRFATVDMHRSQGPGFSLESERDAIRL
jgi:hypothetical protein